MSTEEKIALLEEVLEVDEGTLSLDTKLDDVEEYDSTSKLSIMVTIKDEFGVDLSADTVRCFQTVQDIVDVMK